QDDEEEADDAGRHARAYRVGTEAGAHGALFEVAYLRRERARAQRERELVRRVLREVAVDLARVRYLRLDEGRALHLVVEDDGHVRADVGGSPRAELLRARRLQSEADAVALFARSGAGGDRLGAAEFASVNDGRGFDDDPRLRLVGVSRVLLPGLRRLFALLVRQHAPVRRDAAAGGRNGGLSRRRGLHRGGRGRARAGRGLERRCGGV